MTVNELKVLGLALFFYRLLAGARWSLPPAGQRYAATFDAVENKYSLPKGMLGRVAYQESRFRKDIIDGDVKSKAGAVGIMQIIPQWHPKVDAENPIASIDYAGRYLREMRNRFGSWRYALAAYNWGPGNLAKYIADPRSIKMPKETDDYVRQISHDIGI